MKGSDPTGLTVLSAAPLIFYRFLHYAKKEPIGSTAKERTHMATIRIRRKRSGALVIVARQGTRGQPARIMRQEVQPNQKKDGAIEAIGEWLGNEDPPQMPLTLGDKSLQEAK